MILFLHYFPYVAIVLSNIYGFIMGKKKSSKEVPLLIHSFFWGSFGILSSTLIFNRRKSSVFWIFISLIVGLQIVVSYYLFVNEYWEELIAE